MARLSEEQAGNKREMVALAHEAMGEWLESIGEFTHFVTRTFRDDDLSMGFSKIGISTARKCVVDMLRVSGARAAIVVVEWQKERRVPHLHALLEIPHSVDEKWLTRRDDEFYGFSRWMAYEKDKGAAAYVGKYVAKDLHGTDEVELYLWHHVPIGLGDDTGGSRKRARGAREALKVGRV